MKKLILVFVSLILVFVGSSVLAEENWFENVQVSGYIETQAGIYSADYDDGVRADETSSDIDLTWMDLSVDAKVSERVDGHVKFLWTPDELVLDEGFVTLTGSDSMPVYLIAGRQYVSVGDFTSFFVSDPTTLLLGETTVGAAVVGYKFEEGRMDVSLGLFNGKVDETGEDDKVDSIVAKISAMPVEGLTVGATFSSNLSSSNRLAGNVVTGTLDSLVAGYSAFVNWKFLDHLTLIGEYVGAAGEFGAGELYDAAYPDAQPAAWNVELGYAINEAWNVAARYGGSDDGAELMHESEFGVVANWGVFDNTTLSLEYLHGTYEDDVLTDDALTLQLALVF